MINRGQYWGWFLFKAPKPPLTRHPECPLLLHCPEHAAQESMFVQAPMQQTQRHSKRCVGYLSWTNCPRHLNTQSIRFKTSLAELSMAMSAPEPPLSGRKSLQRFLKVVSKLGSHWSGGSCVRTDRWIPMTAAASFISWKSLDVRTISSADQFFCSWHFLAKFKGSTLERAKIKVFSQHLILYISSKTYGHMS